MLRLCSFTNLRISRSITSGESVLSETGSDAWGIVLGVQDNNIAVSNKAGNIKKLVLCHIIDCLWIKKQQLYQNVALGGFLDTITDLYNSHSFAGFSITDSA
jgi:hypothetical protein